MPELPEVETARARLEKTLKGRKIVKVQVDREDLISFDQASPNQVAKALRGATVTGTDRKGKFFWLELDRKPWVVLHFGMTGNIEIRRPSRKKSLQSGWGGVTLWQARRPDFSKPPRFCRLLLTLADGTQVAMTDPRKFGRIRLSDDPAMSPSIRRLGIDPLKEAFPVGALREKLQRRKAPIKAVLLDQKTFAGVGNWIADEVLYQAGLDPHRLAHTLSPKEVGKLHRKLLSVLRTSVRLEADYDLYPKSWLFHYRWGKEKNAQDHRGRAILHETIGGRTSAWVPEVQYRTLENAE